MSNIGASEYGGATVVDGPTQGMAISKDKGSHRPQDGGAENGLVISADTQDLPFVDVEEYLAVKRPFCVKIGQGGVVAALKELDDELRSHGMPRVMSRKRAVTWTGREVQPGFVGIYTHSASPKLIIKSGRYPRFPFGWWWARDWVGSYNLTDTKVEHNGLLILQVSQNQAAVCQDPQNQIFVVKNAGFVATATRGSYKVLDIVDQTHLGTTLSDKYTKTILAYQQDVMMDRRYVAATFLDIPANNVVVLQRENKLFELEAGQHHITHANVKIRGAFTRGEVQHEVSCDDIYTRDQVPVWLRMYLRWELQQPLQLTRHGYSTPFDALQDKTRSILTQILAHLDYSSMAKQRNLANDLAEPGDDAATAFVDAVRSQATDDLRIVAIEYGILLKDLAIVDRKFKGEIARKMDSLTTRALEAQVEASNLDRENANRQKKQQGDLRVAELQNQQARAAADTAAFATITQAKARAEALTIEAEAQAASTRIAAQAEADAVRYIAGAEAQIDSPWAQSQARARLEVQRTTAFGNRTVFVPTEFGQAGGGAMLAGLGMSLANKAK